MAMNGKFIQQRGCELAAEYFHEPHLKSLQYDIITTQLDVGVGFLLARPLLMNSTIL